MAFSPLRLSFPHPFLLFLFLPFCHNNVLLRQDGNAGLHCATKNGDPRMIELLIRKGAQVDVRDTWVSCTQKDHEQSKPNCQALIKGRLPWGRSGLECSSLPGKLGMRLGMSLLSIAAMQSTGNTTPSCGTSALVPAPSLWGAGAQRGVWRLGHACCLLGF